MLWTQTMKGSGNGWRSTLPNRFINPFVFPDHFHSGMMKLKTKLKLKMKMKTKMKMMLDVYTMGGSVILDLHYCIIFCGSCC
jgi:hypothetical protein